MSVIALLILNHEYLIARNCGHSETKALTLVVGHRETERFISNNKHEAYEIHMKRRYGIHTEGSTLVRDSINAT